MHCYFTGLGASCTVSGPTISDESSRVSSVGIVNCTLLLYLALLITTIWMLQHLCCIFLQVSLVKIQVYSVWHKDCKLQKSCTGKVAEQQNCQFCCMMTHFLLSFDPCSWMLRTQKLKSHLVRAQSLNILPLKPGVGQYTAIHATLNARDFFLAYFYPSSPFTCIFPNLSQFFLCWLWLTHGSCVDPQNKIGHTAGCRFTCWVPAEYK